MANRAIVYAIYPNLEQNILCQKTFGCSRFVYNNMLTLQKDRHNDGEKHLSKTAANTYCNNVLKNKYPFLREVDKFALTNAIYNLEDGFKRFFKKQSKYPKYKSKHKCKKAYTTNFTNNNIEIGDNYIKLPKLGNVKASVHRRPESDWKLKSATITQNRDYTFQVSVLFEYDMEVTKAQITADSSIGLDYKSDGLYADSEGNTCDMPHYFRESAKVLAKAQRKLKHKVVGSNNYKKQQKAVAKIHRHIANQRKDYLQKKSTEIANQYSCVCVEDLNMKSLANSGFGNGKATLDNGYGMFLKMLEYKLDERGGILVKIDKWYPSSQICHCCGKRHKEMKDLNLRTITCDCGYVLDRDYNAALNIKSEGLRQLTS